MSLNATQKAKILVLAELSNKSMFIMVDLAKVLSNLDASGQSGAEFFDSRELLPDYRQRQW